MTSDDSPVPRMIAQAEGIEAVVDALVAGIEPGWSELRYLVQAASSSKQQLRVVRDGVETRVLPPRPADLAAKAMRDRMYEPGTGTWFSLEVTVSDTGEVSTHVNFDDDPGFDPPLDPISFANDQDKYPRDPQHQPEWLRSRIAEGEARRAEQQTASSDVPNGPPPNVAPPRVAPPSVPPMIAQAQGIQAIAEALVADTEPGWSQLRYRVQATAAVMGTEMSVVRDGADGRVFPPRDADRAAKAMRACMYQPGKGTWFTMELTVTDAGKVSTDFNYDDEPQFRPPIDPIAFALDQEKFPRDPDNQPEWLRQRIAEGEARRAEQGR